MAGHAVTGGIEVFDVEKDVRGRGYFTSTSSTSKINIELGGMSSPA